MLTKLCAPQNMETCRLNYKLIHLLAQGDFPTILLKKLGNECPTFLACLLVSGKQS